MIGHLCFFIPDKTDVSQVNLPETYSGREKGYLDGILITDKADYWVQKEPQLLFLTFPMSFFRGDRTNIS